MVYKVNKERIIFTALGEEGVVFDIQSNEYLTLNETFFKILKSIDEQLDFDNIVSLLQNEYEISKEDCEKEVMNSINLLSSKGFITN